MNDMVKTYFESRISVFTPYLSGDLDPTLRTKTEAVIEGMRAIAESSVDENDFERKLAASPVNAEYGMVYYELMTKGTAPISTGQAMKAAVAGIKNDPTDFKQTLKESVVTGAIDEVRFAAKEAALDATREQHQAAHSAMRDVKVTDNVTLGEIETAGNILSGLKGLFGRKK
ncbi:MAG: hypothetical protein ACI4BI_03735 [Anaerotardibacter sp.]